MPDESYPLVQLVKKDSRYPIEAYLFVREALAYAADVLNLGSATPTAPKLELGQGDRGKGGERHLTGQQLCNAIRHYATNQYGFMARVVLQSWGITCTGDFGNIVYNMIGAGLMKKSESDRRSDFDQVYDFELAFDRHFEIGKTPAPRYH